MTFEADDLRAVLAALERVRIFPLPSSVLIPGGHLPLHVFEPRYREMVEDILASDQVVGVPLLTPGWEQDYEERPPIFTVMGVGIIRAADRLPDGRLNILVQGITRARVVEERDSGRLYRVVRAEPFADVLQGSRQAIAERKAQVLRQLAVDLAAALPDQAGPAFAKACVRERDPGRLADLAAAAVLIDTRERQAFLEEADVVKRLDEAADVVAKVLLQVSGNSGGFLS